MVAQLAMMPMADRSRAMRKAADGTTRLRNTPSTVKPAVSAIPANGTPCRVILSVNRGPLRLPRRSCAQRMHHLGLPYGRHTLVIFSLVSSSKYGLYCVIGA